MQEAREPRRSFELVQGDPLFQREYTPWQDFKFFIMVWIGPVLILAAVVMVVYGLL